MGVECTDLADSEDSDLAGAGGKHAHGQDFVNV